MNIWWFLGIELFLTTATISLLWGLSLWRRRKNHTKNMSALLETLEKAEIERSEHYNQWLKTHRNLGEEDALLLVSEWLESEKAYWRAFVAWQLNPDSSGPTGLVKPLHQLMDTRLDSLTQLDSSSPVGPESSEEPQTTQPEAQDTNPQTASPEQASPSSDEDEGPTVLSDAPAEDAVQVSGDSPQAALPDDPPQDAVPDEELVILSDAEDEAPPDQETVSGEAEADKVNPTESFSEGAKA